MLTKKFKIIATFLTILLLTTIMSVGVSAASAQLIKIDKGTSGNWVGTYGSDGYYIIIDDDSLNKLPSYAKVSFEDGWGALPQYWVWRDSETEKGNMAVEAFEGEGTPWYHYGGVPLYKNADKEFYIAACYYDGSNLVTRVEVGSEPKIVSLYMADYDCSPGRERGIGVTVYDEKDNPLVPLFEVDEYTAGCYLVFEISGSVIINYEITAGENLVLSGLFFDPLGSAADNRDASLAHLGGSSDNIPANEPNVPDETDAPANSNNGNANDSSKEPANASAEDESSGINIVVLCIAIGAAVIVIVVVIIILVKRKKNHDTDN